jgi:carboxylesterase type B
MVEHLAVVFVSLSILFAVTCVGCATADPTLVQTQAGAVRGVAGDGYYRWTIPYAEPPVGSLRWKYSQPKSSWAPDVLDGTNFGSKCAHGIWVDAANEDCLYLNVWTPAHYSPTSGFPVMFWIHGGGFTAGASSYRSYWGDFIANSTDTVLVTINYRLGALGWLASPSLYAGNFGLSDQILALKWVASNIKAFGGDPSRVTISGQSAGGISTGVLLVSPEARGLFSAAIIQSNPFATHFRKAEENTEQNEILALRMGCLSIKDVDCMMNASVAKVVEAQNFDVWVPFPIDVRQQIPFQPTIDGKYVTAQTIEAIAHGDAADVPVVLGDVRNETTSWAYLDSKPMSTEEWHLLLDALFRNSTRVREALTMYPALADSRLSMAQLSADYLFACATRYAAILLSQKNKSPVRWYTFLHVPHHDVENSLPECASNVCHSAELAYVFHTLSAWGNNYTAAEETLSWQMMQLWTGFVHNDKSLESSWPQFTYDARTMLAFDVTGIGPIDGYRQQQCDFWDTVTY